MDSGSVPPTKPHEHVVVNGKKNRNYFDRQIGDRLLGLLVGPVLVLWVLTSRLT